MCKQKSPQYTRYLFPVEPHRNSLNFISLPFTSQQITSYKSPQFSPHHFTYLHAIPTLIPLLVTVFLTLCLKVFNLHGKDASKPAGSWFQLLIVHHINVTNFIHFHFHNHFIVSWSSTCFGRQASIFRRHYTSSFWCELRAVVAVG
jgi:hypothetical protein